MKSHRRILRTQSTKPSRAGPLEMGRWPLKITRSKQESTATIKLVNLATKRDSVFMASSSGWGPQRTPFWREGAVLAHPSWLRLRRVRVMVALPLLDSPPPTKLKCDPVELLLIVQLVRIAVPSLASPPTV